MVCFSRDLSKVEFKLIDTKVYWRRKIDPLPPMFDVVFQNVFPRSRSETRVAMC